MLCRHARGRRQSILAVTTFRRPTRGRHSDFSGLIFEKKPGFKPKAAKINTPFSLIAKFIVNQDKSDIMTRIFNIIH